MLRQFFIALNALALFVQFLPVANCHADIIWASSGWTDGDLSGNLQCDDHFVSVTIGGDTGTLDQNTPSVDTGLNGSSITLETFHLQMDPVDGSQFVTATFEFDHPSGITELSFDIFDIDTSPNWHDRVIVEGFKNGLLLPPPTVTQDASAINVSGGVLNGAEQDNFQNNLDRRTARISFGSAILDKLVVTFTDGQTSNPLTHGIALSDMTLTSVPEPNIQIPLLVALGFGFLFRICRRKKGWYEGANPVFRN